MEKTNKKPEVRFKGFTEDWELKELKELAETFEYGLNAAAIDYDGINKYIRITDIDDESHEFNTKSLTSPGTDLSIADNYKLKEGDLLFARTGASVGKSYRYKNTDGLVYYAGFLIRARIKPEFYYEFVFQNTLTKDYNNFIRLTSQRSGQPGVNAREYSEFAIMVPKLGEQQQIGTYFKNLDHLITLRQQKYDKLVTIKKSMLEKMFPKNGALVPEIRFKGFSGAWEEHELGEVSKIKGRLGWKSLKQNEYLNEGPSMIAGRHINNGVIDWSIVDHIPKWRYDESPEIMLKNGDVIFSKDGSLGNPAIIKKLKGYATINSTMMLVRPYSRINSNFFYQVLKTKRFDDLIRLKVSGSSIPHLFQADMKKFTFIAPKLKEQKRIGIFFDNIENLLTLHQTELKKLKNIKKACLEKMFV